MPAANLCTAENLFDFFHEHVDAAVAHEGGVVSEEGVYYLANLLVERGRVQEQVEQRTIVDLHLMAREDGGTRAIAAWREVGDMALYVTGFFRQSLARRSVSVDYYLSMGASAYQSLSHSLRGPGSGIGLDAIYEELACSFEACSDVLQNVRDALRAHTHSEILQLYEAWLATGDARAAARLRDLGVVPMRPGDEQWGVVNGPFDFLGPEDDTC